MWVVAMAVVYDGAHVPVDLDSWLPRSWLLPSSCVCIAQAAGVVGMIVMAGRQTAVGGDAAEHRLEMWLVRE